MHSREELIARKSEVQARMHALRIRLDAATMAAEGAAGLRKRYYSARRASMEAELDQLMAEEMRLRLEIDRHPIRTTRE